MTEYKKYLREDYEAVKPKVKQYAQRFKQRPHSGVQSVVRKIDKKGRITETTKYRQIKSKGASYGRRVLKLPKQHRAVYHTSKPSHILNQNGMFFRQGRR